MLLPRHVIGLFFAAMFVVVAVDSAVHTQFGAGGVGLVMGVVLAWLSLRGPVRMRRAYAAARAEGLRERAEAGHQAFLRGETGQIPIPDDVPDPPLFSRGARIAAVVCAVLLVIGTFTMIFGERDEDGAIAGGAAAGVAAVAVSR